MPRLASYDECTGCGACSVRCPRGCISMAPKGVSGAIHPTIDTGLCVECGGCEKVCPPINSESGLKSPTKCYAARTMDEVDRRACASGGIAHAIYEHYIGKGGICVGASMNSDWTVSHKIAVTAREIEPFKNSKYVFSEAYGAFRDIPRFLRQGREVVMIGLPCQIAAARNLFGNHPRLLLVDIVCHGAVPDKFLQQHIEALEKKSGIRAARMSFRAPEKGTANYFFTLYDEKGKIFYSKRSSMGDTYNIAFHREIAYRENCYNCRYSKPERVSDITLGDFHGLGSITPCDYAEEEVSAILVHTPKGLDVIGELIGKQRIFAEERPVMESVSGDARLTSPSSRSKQQRDFAKYIRRYCGDFEKTMAMVLAIQKRDERVNTLLSFPRRAVRKVLRLISR